MRFITHCPNCHTQFFATEAQLNQHGGKVRCGQCLQVFDAKAQLINTEAPEKTPGNSQTPVESAQLASTSNESAQNTEHSVQPVLTQPAYFEDAADKTKLKKSLAQHGKSRWLWLLATVLLMVAAILQSAYFLRNQIALAYPALKPMLQAACVHMQCTITLPQRIEFIVINDSDLHEDPQRAGLIHFSANLINTGTHAVAMPNLELTLTDTEEKPVLRRVFKPHEYLPADIVIEDGLKPEEELVVKLTLNTSDIAVAGYRIFVTY